MGNDGGVEKILRAKPMLNRETETVHDFVTSGLPYFTSVAGTGATGAVNYPL